MIPPTTYGFEKVTFGDKPTGAICAAAIQLTADMYYCHIDEDAGRCSNENETRWIHMDDVTTVLKRRNVSTRWRRTNQRFHQIRRLFCQKANIGRVLGVAWDPESDQFAVTVRVNDSKKHKGLRPEPDMPYEEIPSLLTMKLTRRVLLGLE